jgi:DNA recombination-dependent growth factor C
MGLARGSVSFVRFKVDGSLPADGEDFLVERLKLYTFRDIDNHTDELSVGWVSLGRLWGLDLNYPPALTGDHLVASLRIDQRKVAPALINKFVQKEEAVILKQKQIPSLTRVERRKLKNKVRANLLAKAVPVAAMYDICWNLAESSLLLCGGNAIIEGILEDFFKQCFDLILIRDSPLEIAAIGLSEEQASSLRTASPAVFA